jgi:phospholipid/cholesterol/gamma-HCH transport system permease protein
MTAVRAMAPADESATTTVGMIVYDAGRFLRAPGLRYWRKVFEHAARVFRTTAPLTVWLSFFIGTAVTFQAINLLSVVGADRGLAAVIVGSVGLREVSIIMALFGVSASVGAGFVTELGAMRVAEEIDALEVMGISSHPYLIGTRIFGAAIATVPLIIFSVGAVFLGGWAIAYTQSDAVNMASFSLFFWRVISPLDFVFVVFKGTCIAVATAMIGASCGYRATGGPVGVGLAVGRALNLAVVCGVLMNLAFSYIFWGTKDTIRL